MSFSELDKKDKIDFAIALGVVLLMIGFVLYFSFYVDTPADEPSYTPSGPSEQVNLHVDSIQIDQYTYVSRSKESNNSDNIRVYQRLDRTSGSDANSTISQSGQSQNITGFATTIDEILQDAEFDEPAQDDATHKLLEESIIGDSIGLANEAVTGASQIAEGSNSVIAEDVAIKESIVDTDRDCIIIIGAYRKSNNVARLTSQLQADGYDVITTPYKGATRVGVSHTCADEELQRTLKYIRTKYAEDAVLLD